MKAIPGEFPHALVVADIDKKKIRKIVRMTCTERRNIGLLKDVMIRKIFEEIKLSNQIRIGFYRHVMRCVVISERGEVKEIHGGGVMR